jgi:hypothetical protein
MSAINRKGDECECGSTTYHVRTPGCTPPSRATYDASTDPVPKVEPALALSERLGRAFNAQAAKERVGTHHMPLPTPHEPDCPVSQWHGIAGPGDVVCRCDPATDPARIRTQAKAQRALEPVPPLVGPDATRKDWEEVVAWAREAVRESDRPLTAADFLVTPEVLELWKTAQRRDIATEQREAWAGRLKPKVPTASDMLADAVELLGHIASGEYDETSGGIQAFLKRVERWVDDSGQARTDSTQECMTCAAKRRQEAGQ